MFIITLFLLLISPFAYSGTNLSCSGFPKSYSISFNSEVLLVKSAVEPATQNELIASSIIFQNLYVYPELPNLQANKDMIRWGGFEKKDIDFSVTKTEEVKLPYSLEIDATIPRHYPDSVKTYLNKIAERKKIAQGESALRVSYKAKIKLDLCQNKDETYKEINWPIPKEPYLAYFLVPIHKRLDLKNKLEERAVTNPCATINQIGSKGLIDPWSYWFFWSPQEIGIDANKKPFNCTNILSEGVQWEDPKPKMDLLPSDHAEPDFTALKELKRPLKLSFIYSAFQYHDFKPYSENDKNKINGVMRDLIISKNDQLSMGQLQASLKEYDPALTAGMMLLWNVKRNSIFKKYVININDNKIEIIIRGILKLSSKSYELKLFISPNQPDHPGHQDFKVAMTNALSNDDVVIYTGHAGFGSYLGSSLRALRENMVIEKNVPAYQFVALFSCASNLYYPEEYFAKPSTSKYRRDYVHSISTLADGSSHGATLVLGLIDQSMRMDKKPPFSEWVKAARYDNFIKFKTVEKNDE
ncbi:MAG: hypothetical protein K2P81_06495 [Bacteriovoracaceae bacterium]|nr:hypothetical protein [Bacteriovoracaceae bacterium]